MYEAAASCKDIARAPVTHWEPHCVRLAGYCYAVRHGIKVQLVSPQRVSHLQRYGVTERGNLTFVYPPYDEAGNDEYDLPTLSTYMWYISSFDGQNVIQLLDASQAAYHLKDTDKFCFVRMLASWETILYVLLGFAGTAMLILYWYSKPTLHYWKKIGVKLLKPLSLLGNTKKSALNKSSPAEVFRDLYFLKLYRFLSGSEKVTVTGSCE